MDLPRAEAEDRSDVRSLSPKIQGTSVAVAPSPSASKPSSRTGDLRAGGAGPFPIDWGSLAPLRLKARAVAEGVYAGMHRSVRKGAGVEFGATIG